MENYTSLYEEKCREVEELRAEIENVRASTSTAVSFICTRLLFLCNAAFRAHRRRKNMASILFWRRTKRSNTQIK